VEMSDDALATLKQYRWPGNVRELRNLVERLLILNPKTTRLEKKHLPMLVYRESRDSREVRDREGRRGEEFATLLEAREAYERDFILKKIDEVHGNMSRAAEALGLERSHLYRKMKALGVAVKE
jgi:two-component system nitrogen regulation response regulator NtrX